MSKGSDSYELMDGVGVGKELILRWGIDQRLSSWGGRNFPPPPLLFLIAPRMNVYYISKHKKLFWEEKGLCLLWNEGGRRKGCQSIDSETAVDESKAW